MSNIQPLSLPAEAQYESFEALFSSCQQHAKQAGYAFIKQKLERRNGRLIRFIACKSSGSFKSKYTDNDTPRQRTRNTHKTGCMVSLKAREGVDGQWTLCHRHPEFSVHNHEASNSSSFIEHRHLDPERKSRVRELISTGVRPKQISLILREEDPTISTSHRDIYNIRAETARQERRGLSSSQALITNMERGPANGENFFRYQLDTSRRISMIFFAVCRAVQYARNHFEILLLDCTYKTNKFDMPLLHFMGVDHHGNSFTIGLCFLDREIQSNYDKALEWLIEIVYTNDGVTLWPSAIVTDCEVALTNAIDQKFPSTHSKRILCRWHMMKNIYAKYKPVFQTEVRWEDFRRAIHFIIDSKTIDEFEDTIQELKNEFNFYDGASQNSEQQAVAYVLGQWFEQQREFVVTAWFDKYFHCGNTTTSRIEGGHRRLKDWITGSSNDLQSVINACRLAISSQLNEIDLHVSHKLSTTSLALTGPKYSHCIGHISHNGLCKLRQQFDLLRDRELKPESRNHASICTGLFTAAHGILCWHKLKLYLQENRVVTPNDFHPFWHINRSAPTYQAQDFQQPILDPLSRTRRRIEQADQRAQARGNARLQTAASGRILSQFEQIETQLRHCSLCTPNGHNKRSCRGCTSTNHNRSYCPSRVLNS